MHLSKDRKVGNLVSLIYYGNVFQSTGHHQNISTKLQNLEQGAMQSKWYFCNKGSHKNKIK